MAIEAVAVIADDEAAAAYVDGINEVEHKAVTEGKKLLQIERPDQWLGYVTHRRRRSRR